MKKNFLFTAFLFSFLMISAQNVRLAKSIYEGNNLTEITEYSYSLEGKIQKMKRFQNGKLTATSTDFTFNEAGLVIYFKTIFELKTFPQKTTITYDQQNRMESYITKTVAGKVMKSKKLSYKGNVITVTSPLNLSFKNIYVFNDNADIMRSESVGSLGSAATTLYGDYDLVKNPLTLRGGFMDDEPVSKHNSAEDHYAGSSVQKRQLIYSKKTVSTNIPAGPKIPTQQKNDLLLKAIVTSIDKNNNQVIPISTTTYEYINLK